MIGSNVKLALGDRITTRGRPTLSLYLDVNPGRADNTERAFVLRAAEAMRGLGLDKSYIDSVTGKLSREFGRVEGRTLVLFADADLDELFDAYYLQTELPFLLAAGGAMANWGEPMVAPLLFVLDQHERYGVIYVASDHVRLFEAFLGQMAELGGYERDDRSDEWVRYREARKSPSGGFRVAARGGASTDRHQNRVEEATARMYRTVLPGIEEALTEFRADRVILMGTQAAVTAFRGVMSQQFGAKVVGTLPAPANPSAPAHEWVGLVRDLIEETEAAHELELLDRVRESGVWGLEETLSLLQEFRISTLVVPWSALPTVYRAAGGRVATTPAELGVLSPGEDVSEVPLIEVLPELVNASNATLEFTEGPAEKRLIEEFGGMAGLKRW